MYSSKNEYVRSFGNNKEKFLTGYERLACEIILQAIWDWRSADDWKDEYNRNNRKTELRIFFKSDWCDALLGLCEANFSGLQLLEWLEHESENKLKGEKT